jgi:hypothetical protein
MGGAIQTILLPRAGEKHKLMRWKFVGTESKTLAGEASGDIEAPRAGSWESA